MTWNPRANELFLKARELASPADRAAFLDQQCADDPRLRAEVEALLAADGRAGDFLERPAANPDATVTYTPAADRPGDVIGPYKLLQLIGEGGMGAVFLAEQTQPVQRRVALKVIKAGMDTRGVLARFEAERQALALMDHPNIARVLDAGTTAAGRPYFVMELVKGVPITRHCDEHRLTPEERLELFVQVCQAVQHAHQKGVIHRDLKPSNVLVAPYDGRPVVKVIDFGVAKATGGRLTDKTLFTAFGAMVGTLEYMSPEQAELNNQDIDTRSDVYALGVLLYELLTGTTPLDRDRLRATAFAEVLRLIREEEPPRPSTRLSDSKDSLPAVSAQRRSEPGRLTKLVRGELDWIVMKALEKDRSRRYESASGLALDVQCYLADEPVLAGPPTNWYRLRKFAQRNKAALATASVVTVALFLAVATLAVSTVLIWQEKEQTRGEWQRAEKEKERAELEKERAEADRRLTRKALDEMTSEVIEDFLARNPRLTAEQQKYFETMLGYYRQFAAQTGETEEARADVAGAYVRVGVFSSRLGRAKQAEEAYREAERLWTQLAADYPAKHLYRRNVALSQHNRANLLKNAKQLTEAETALGAAIPVHRKLAAEFPAQSEYQNDLAGALVDLAELRKQRNDLQGARRLLEEAHPYHQAALKAQPRDTGYRKFYRNNLAKLAEVFEGLGDFSAALTARGDSLALDKQLAADFPEDPAHRQNVAYNQTAAASLLASTNQPQKAEAAYREALTTQEQLANDFPAVPLHRHNLAVTSQNLGVLLFNLKRMEDAQESFRRALKNWQLLAQRYPAVQEYRYGLGVSHNQLASFLSASNRPKEAEPEFRASLQILQDLTKDNSALPEHRFRLADTHNNLGTMLTSVGRTVEAETEYRLSLAIQEGLVREFPATPLYSVTLARTFADFGELHRKSGRPEAAMEWYDKAIATVEPVHRKEPRFRLGRSVLRHAFSSRAESLAMLKRYADAVKDWDRAIASDDEKLAEFRLKRADALARSGEHARATAEAELLAEPANALKEVVYDAACIYSLSSAGVSSNAQLAERYAARAVELLRRASQKGFRDVKHIEKDSDLDSLRQREDFKKLLAELQSKGSAG